MANYVFDTSIGLTNTSPTQNLALGGTNFGAPSPLISASVTINGTTVQVFGGVGDEIFAQALTYLNVSQQYAVALGPNAELLNTVTSTYGMLPPTIDVPFTYTLSPTDRFTGWFDYWRSPSGSPSNPETYANFRANTLTVSAVGAVPEPSTWVMMLLGFAGLGFMAYRRKQNGSALAAL